MLRNADGDGGGGSDVRFSRKKHYEGVMFNVISLTRGWVILYYWESNLQKNSVT